jgi:hypothetical protein
MFSLQSIEKHFNKINKWFKTLIFSIIYKFYDKIVYNSYSKRLSTHYLEFINIYELVWTKTILSKNTSLKWDDKNMWNKS